jgi:very-short-patch-repair endonuclease
MNDVMTPIIFIGVLIFIFIIISLKNRRMPYFKQTALLTKSELHFYQTLKQVIPENQMIMMKVRMADIINCDDNAWKAGWGARISGKHIDFILIDTKTTEIKIAIELDDSTHRTNKNRIERDVFVNKAFEVAGVSLLRIKTQRFYKVDEIQQCINQAIVRDQLQR